MSEPVPDSPPTTLDALAAAAVGDPWTFTVDGKTGTLRRQLFGDLRAYASKKTGLEKVMVLLERCADEDTLAILDAMTVADGMAIFDQWEAWIASLPGK